MEDAKLKELFGNFQPPLSSGDKFMERLRKNMEAVEYVKQYTTAMRRRNRVAIAVAALSGFAMGVILTLLYPLFAAWLSTVKITIPHFAPMNIDFSIIAWIGIALACVATSVNAYEVTISRLKI